MQESYKTKTEFMSYREFYILCISPTLFFIIVSLVSNFFSNVVPEKYVIEVVVTLQGLLAMSFILKRNPDINTKIDDFKMDKIKLVLVGGTFMISWILFAVLYGIYQSFFEIF